MRRQFPGGGVHSGIGGLLFAVALSASTSTAQTIETAAGGGPDNGPAIARPLGSPRAVALDGSGNRYVASSSLNRVFKIDTAGQLTILAGNGAPDFSGDGGPATSAALLSPRGVAVDTAGNIFISDTFNNRIRKVTAATGVITTFAGNGTPGFFGDGGPATSAMLDTPEQIVFDTAGNMFIADTFNHRIRRVDATTGFISTVAGNGSPGFSGDGGNPTLAQLNQPRGVAVDGAGSLFIGDNANHRVRKVSGGTITTLAGTGVPGFSGDGGAAASAQLNFPTGLAMNAGSLYIADSSNHRIRKTTGTVISTVAGNGTLGFGGDGGPATAAMLGTPSGLTFDTSGHMYLADTFNNRLRRVDGATQFISTVAGNGDLSFYGDGGDALLAVLGDPRGVARDASGNLYIADELNNRVRKVNPAGTITTVAGNGQNGFGGDGSLATAASLSQPWGVVLDASGNLFIADTFNHRIRRVDATTQVITTVAGNGTVGPGGDGGPATSASLNYPSGVAVDSAGRIYIADQLNNRVRRVAGGIITNFAGTGTSGFSGDGGPATAAQLDGLQGIALDAVGNLYVADTFNHRIRRVDAVMLTISTVAGNGTPGFSGDGGPATGAGLNLPTGIAIDGGGNQLIADRNNHRIRMVEARTGRITTVAGNGVIGFFGDGGPATSARLNNPFGVALDATGQVHVGDTKNQRIRRFGLGADLEIAKADGQTVAVPGTNISYTITVTNHGPNVLAALNVNDPVPTQILSPIFVAATGSYDPGTGDWTGLSLGTGQSAVLTLSGLISPGARGSLVNNATVSPPLGLSDPFPGNNTAFDTDVLNPSAQLALTKNGNPAALDLGSTLTYTLDVANGGPSSATSVTIGDFLPQEVVFDSASAGCTYDPFQHRVTCNLGTVAPGPPRASSIHVRPFAPGRIFNQAGVTSADPDPQPDNNGSSATTFVTVPTGAARFFTVTSFSDRNVLEWLNPIGRDTVRIRFNSGLTSCIFPADTDEGMPLEDARVGPIGGHDSITHPATNGMKYCYTIFVDLGGSYSKGRSNRGRPFDTSGAVKLAYSIGTTSLAPPGVGATAIHAVGNDYALHAFVKATLPNEGLWPTGWAPRGLPSPSQGRPNTIVATTPHLIYLGSQDGNVYATNAITGAPVWNRLLVPPAGSMVQAAPSGIFAAFGTEFGIDYSYVLVGTRSTEDNRFYALDINTGAPAWWVDGSPWGLIGAINAQAAVDYATERVYFTSRARNAGANTVWCVRLDTHDVLWVRALGDSDVSPTLRNGRLYVATNDGKIRALDAATGNDLWAMPFSTGDGMVKGFILPDRPGDDLYFSTKSTIWKLRDGGATPPELKWSRPSPPATPDLDFNFPATPVLQVGVGKLWVGSDKGTLLTLNAADGSNLIAPITLGDGKAAVGSPTIDSRSGLMYVGTEAGIIYAVERP